jgi:hypothetical protein
MICEATSEAETMAALANDGRNDARQLVLRNVTLDSVFAIRCRTPPEKFVVVDIGAEEKGLVSEN